MPFPRLLYERKDIVQRAADAARAASTAYADVQLRVSELKAWPDFNNLSYPEP